MAELLHAPTSNGLQGVSASSIASAVAQGTPSLPENVRTMEVNAQNFSQFGELIYSNDDFRNAYIHTLMDKVGLYYFGYNVFNNDLRSLKKDFLRTGAVVDELEMDLIESMPYNPELDWSKALANYVPTYLELFHRINRQVVYPLSISRIQLQRAFTSEQSFMEFLSMQFALPVESNNADEYEQFLKLTKYISDNVAYHVKTAGFNNKDNTTLSMQSIRQWTLDLQKPSRDFNVAGFKRSVPIERMFLIIKSDALASADVNVLAAAFQLPYADFLTQRVYTVPSWADLGNGVDALLGDIRAFQVYDTEYATDDNKNGLTRTINYFLHVGQIFSSSITYPVIAFTNQEIVPVVLGSFTPDPTTTNLAKGSTTLIKCAITSGTNKQIHYSLSGNVSDATQITPYGLLYVGQKETATELTVTATVKDGSNGSPVTKIATYNVTQ